MTVKRVIQLGVHPRGLRWTRLSCLCFQEHHLQRALSAQHVFQEKQENLVIPVPKAEGTIPDYERLYRGDIRVPKQLIRVPSEWPSEVHARTWF